LKSAVKVIIPASGSGVRFGGKTAKQFILLNGKEILAHSIKKFQDEKIIDEIIVSSAGENFEKIKNIVRKNKFSKVKKIAEGGKRRQDSVYNALINLECGMNDIILIHDAVRPFVTGKLIKEVVSSLQGADCVIPAVSISDTIVRTDKNNFVKEVIDREGVYAVQTPQAFRYDVLMQCFSKANRDGYTGTDEASIVRRYGHKVKVTEGDRRNIKITVKKDLEEAGKYRRK